ncbi:type II secretion system minor pseudopilin GspK [Thermodesulfobacteriota bacterium]
MNKIISDNRGVALIITILILSIIVVLTLEFNRSMRENLHIAVNSKDTIMLNYLARSGYNLALAVLDEDDRGSDSLHDDWALLKMYSPLSNQLFDEGRFQVEIIDLAGRFQINNLVNMNGTYNDNQKELLFRLILLLAPDLYEEEVEDIIDNIKDWIDIDDEPTRFGAEDLYYQSLENSYSCSNGSLKSVEELLRIKNISEDLFFGTLGNPGLRDLVTVHGDGSGKININTAPPSLIMAIAEDMDGEMIDNIISYREDSENDLSEPFWYKDAIGTNEDMIDPSLIGINGDFFTIDSIGLKDNMRRIIRAVVKRTGNTFTLLSWRIS